MTNPCENLTPRQCEILDALVRSGCNKKIAIELGFNTESAVKSTLRRACEKVGVDNRVQLAVLWDRYTREQA